MVGCGEEGVGWCGAVVSKGGVLTGNAACCLFCFARNRGRRRRGGAKGEAAHPIGWVRVEDCAVDVVCEDFAQEVKLTELLDDGKGEREGSRRDEGGYGC